MEFEIVDLWAFDIYICFSEGTNSLSTLLYHFSIISLLHSPLIYAFFYVNIIFILRFKLLFLFPGA